MKPSKYPSRYETSVWEMARLNTRLAEDMLQTQPIELRCDECRCQANSLCLINGQYVCDQCVSAASGVFRAIDSEDE